MPFTSPPLHVVGSSSGKLQKNVQFAVFSLFLSLLIYSWVIGEHIYTYTLTQTQYPPCLLLLLPLLLLRVIFEIKNVPLAAPFCFCFHPPLIHGKVLSLLCLYLRVLLLFHGNKQTERKKKSSRKISQMPICLMARTFMTRHFLNGLWGFSSSFFFPLVFFFVGRRWNDDDDDRRKTKHKRDKKKGKEKRKKLFIGLGCFLMTLLTVFLCTHLECWPLTFAMLVSHMIEEKKSLFSVQFSLVGPI